MGPKERDEQVKIYYDHDCKYPSHQSLTPENENSLCRPLMSGIPLLLDTCSICLRSASQYQQDALCNTSVFHHSS